MAYANIDRNKTLRIKNICHFWDRLRPRLPEKYPKHRKVYKMMQCSLNFLKTRSVAVPRFGFFRIYGWGLTQISPHSQPTLNLISPQYHLTFTFFLSHLILDQLNNELTFFNFVEMGWASDRAILFEMNLSL